MLPAVFASTRNRILKIAYLWYFRVIFEGIQSSGNPNDSSNYFIKRQINLKRVIATQRAVTIPTHLFLSLDEFNFYIFYFFNLSSIILMQSKMF